MSVQISGKNGWAWLSAISKEASFCKLSASARGVLLACVQLSAHDGRLVVGEKPILPLDVANEYGFNLATVQSNMRKLVADEFLGFDGYGYFLAKFRTRILIHGDWKQTSYDEHLPNSPTPLISSSSTKTLCVSFLGKDRDASFLKKGDTWNPLERK